MRRELLDYWRHASDDPFDAFFDHAPIFMHSIDGEGRLVKVSRYWAAALGYPPEDLLGRHFTDFMTEDSRRRALTEVLPRFWEIGTVEGVEYECLRHDGSILPTVLSATSILDKDGRFVRSLAILFDNTEAWTARRTLKSAVERAEEASRAKSRFLAAMSHEIRTPMNAVLGFAQLLKRSGLDDTRAGHVDAILSSGATLMKLLTDLLDLSQVESGRMRIDRRPVDLPDLLDEVAGWWRAAAADKGLRLQVTLDPALPRHVLTDPLRIQQVLSNFLGNAVKFTRTGGITLAASQIARQDGLARLRFEVIDTGPGLTADQRARLFQPFVQIDSDFSTERGGWGLGLSICRNIADAIGGTVGAESDPGAGARFHFDLDLALADASDRPAVAPSPPPPSAPRTPSGLRVLLAEDNAMNQRMLGALLAELGHGVTIVDTGASALAALAEAPHDLVLMDVMMPGLDGLAATAEIRAAGPPLALIPVVACSADVSPEARARARAAGADGFVAKPVDRDALAGAIAAATAARRGGD